MDKQARKKVAEINAERRKKMIAENSTDLALKNGKDTILFGIEREDDGYRVAVYYILENVIVDKKVGASQLKHHCIAIMESYISEYAINSYEHPKAYFDSVKVS